MQTHERLVCQTPPPDTQPGPSGGQAASQPQFGVDVGPEASVECHSSKPWMPGWLTGHFLLAKLDCSFRPFGKKSPKCLQTHDHTPGPPHELDGIDLVG